ncbi:TPA: hypothetical protein HA274_00720 [Candidatus Bathyarchaeota archaeon]|nr:hypothetical protein [Candidatus Bathyarchaeota archaeon]
MNKTMLVATGFILISAILAGALIGAVAHYKEVFAAQNEAIDQLVDEYNGYVQKTDREKLILITQRDEFERQAEGWRENYSYAMDGWRESDYRARDLENILTGEYVNPNMTFLIDVCEKGETYEWGRLPNASYTLQLAVDAFAPYKVLFVPQYQGNLNWTQTFEWMRANLAGFPLCPQMFNGGNGSEPILELSANDLQRMIADPGIDVEMVAFDETGSWHDSSGRPFPTEKVRAVLQVCRAYSIPVVWTEWDTGERVQAMFREATKGYEDMVTFVFQTNNDKVEPFEGCGYARGLVDLKSIPLIHRPEYGQAAASWGLSDQGWYWTERHPEADVRDMPISLLAEFALLAKNMGASVIEFEPYWLLFDNGEPTEALRVLAGVL